MSQKLAESGPRALLTGMRERSSADESSNFETLHHECSAVLRRLAIRLCGNPSDADDLVADVWLHVWLRYQSRDTVFSLGLPYLIATLRNRYWNLCRSQGQRSQSSVSIALLLYEGPKDPEPAYGARGEKLLQLVEQLPPVERNLLLWDRRVSPGTWSVDANEANRLRVWRHRLRRLLAEQCLREETAGEVDGGVPAASSPSPEVPQPALSGPEARRREARDEP